MFGERMRKLRGIGKRMGVDGFFIVPGPNMLYFTGFSIQPLERLTAVIIPVDGDPVLIVPKLEETKAYETSRIQKIKSYDDVEGPIRSLNEALNELRLTKSVLGVEGSLQFRFYRMLIDVAPSLTIKDTSEAFHVLRRIKSQDEIELIRRAAEIVVEGLRAGINVTKVKASELSVSFEIERRIKEVGGETVPFCIVLSGKNSALPHGTASTRRLRKGDAVVMDVGATYKGYTADITRTIFIGEADERQRHVYNVVLEAHRKAMEAIKPEMRASDVDKAARHVIEEAGYGELFTHRTGHGIGLEVHEEPYIRLGNDTLLKSGMTFTVEPGVYMPGRFGVRVEDDVVVTDKGYEMLNRFSKELLIV